VQHYSVRDLFTRVIREGTVVLEGVVLGLGIATGNIKNTSEFYRYFKE